MLSMALNIEGAMKFFGSYSFLTIVSESIKLLPKNGKLMAVIAIFYVFMSSSFLLLFTYSIQSLVDDMFASVLQFSVPDPSSFDPKSFNSADPSSFTPKTGFNPAQIIGQLEHLQRDSAILIAVEIAFFLAFSTISFCSAISTILVSASSYTAKNLSLKELLSMISRTWTMPLITSLYVCVLSFGYFCVVLMLAAPLLMYPDISTFWVAIFAGIPAVIFYLYLLVTWSLSIVVSLVEDSCYGMEALGKAATLVKGKRLLGFLLNFCYSLVVLIVFQGYRMLVYKGFGTISLLLLTSGSSLVKLFLVFTYTLFYFKCKVSHGEEVELHGSFQYAKLPTTV